MKSLIFATAMALSASAASAVVIDFDDLTAGSLISTIDNATFTSSSGGVEVYNFGAYDHTSPNTIGGSSNDFFASLTVSFADAVSNLSFYSGGDNDFGSQASINVFVNGLLDSVVSLMGDGDLDTVDFQDLTAFNNVTSIEIFAVTDSFGLAYDTFAFDVAAVPLPAGGLLLLSAFGGLAFARRRKST